MKFYNRENELAELQRIQELSFEENSHLTVVTGRRRIGKTSLIMRAFEKTPTIYLFVGRKNEAYLCARRNIDFQISLSVYYGSCYQTVIQFGYR